MPRIGCIALALAVVILPPAACAASVVVSGDDPKGAVTVVAEDSTVDEILRELAQKYGFQIKGTGNGAGDTLSIKLSGSLYEVVARLLRNRNVMIVRSAGNASGIEKLTIIDANYGASPTAAGQNPSNNGAEELLQALSGGESAD